MHENVGKEKSLYFSTHFGDRLMSKQKVKKSTKEYKFQLTKNERLGIKDTAYAVDLLKQRVGQLEDELSNTERALDAITDRKKYTFQAEKNEILDVLRYFYYEI